MTDVTAGDADISVAGSSGPTPAVSLVGVNGIAKATVASGAAAGATALQPGGNLTGFINAIAVAVVTAGAALGATALQPAGNLTGQVNGVAVATVTSGAASGATALQPGGNLTGQVGGVAVATVTSGAALGATAVQPNTGATLSGLTITGLSGVVKAAAGVLSAATIVNADVSNTAAIVGTKISPDFGSQNITTTGTSTAAQLTVTQAVATSGSPNAVVVTGAAHTTLAASTEASDVDLNLARTVQFATGALTTQRAVRVRAPTYGFVGASTLTTAATLSITGAPVAGTNATITNAYALYIEAGALAMGASPSPSGDIRISHATSIKGNNSAGGTARNVLDWGATATDTVTIGDSNVVLTALASSGGINLSIAGTVRATLTASQLQMQSTCSTVQFISNIGANCVINIGSTSTTTIRTLLIQGHSSSATSGVTGGAVTIAAGDATGGSGSRTGGGLDLRAGTGATANGALRLLDNATVRLTVNGTGLGLYATAAVAQAARAGALTDSTGGTPSTTLVDVGAVFSQANVNNNFSSLLTKYNALELACHNLGVTA